MSRSRSARRQRRLDRLERRLAFLDQRIEAAQTTGISYDESERAALIWAIGVVESAIELGLIGKLEDMAEYD